MAREYSVTELGERTSLVSVYSVISHVLYTSRVLCTALAPGIERNDKIGSLLSNDTRCGRR